ncbi:MAG: hypothetical protein CMM74_14475 [Rhodospirillaceae bacterium]|mgnify:CR=1 FL=1|nr:hypothetical protein [Rhodospirillaceae bacterium]
MTANSKRLCVDIGGTFTDCLVLDEVTGQFSLVKSPTTPSDPSDGFLDGMAKAAKEFGESIEEFLGSISVLIHGTTLATNVLLTGNGAKTGMLTTQNFRDFLEIRRAIKPLHISLFNVFIPPNRPLVPRYLRLGVPERTLYTGEIFEQLDEEKTAEAVEQLQSEGVEAAAVCFLHSYANPTNELRAAEIVKNVAPDMYVTTSHETIHVWREFERFNTTAVGAYVGPAVANYLRRLEDRLRSSGFGGNMLMMLANGLVQTVDQCIDRAVYFLHSGPAAAPSGARFLGEIEGKDQLLSVDMGGTSFDVGLVRQGEIPTTSESWVADQRVAIRMVDIESVGTGGGSIASIDALGLLKVGPESAGADPGPACFGKGEEPTVTDADLVLGLLSPDYFLGGDMSLDVERSRKAIDKVGKPLDMNTVDAAYSIFTLANMSMADEIIKVSTKRGYDVRQATMIGGGGGGPVHAGFIADRLNIPSVVIPSVASLYSAFGMYAMDIGEDYARSHVRRVDAAEPKEINDLYEEMENEALAAFEIVGVDRKDVKFRRTIDMRYIGQFHEVEVDVDGGDFDSKSLIKATGNFSAKHDELFTFAMPWKGVELLTLRVKATTPNAPFKLPEITSEGTDASSAKKSVRSCYFGNGFIEVQVYDGSKLTADNETPGPAIIEETTTTVVIPENYDCHVNANKNYVLTRRADA